MDIFWGIPHNEHLPWGGLIALYLFLAGIAGGAFVTASLTDLFSKNPSAKLIKTGAYIAPLAIVLGLGLLVLDLSKPFHFWKLLFYVNGSSVMSIGTFIISVFVTLAFIYGFLIWAGSSGGLKGFWAKLAGFINKFSALRKPIAIIGALFAFSTTTYTGFLLAAITANALWSMPFFGLVNVPFLAILFLVSGLSTGLAATMLGAARVDRASIADVGVNAKSITDAIPAATIPIDAVTFPNGTATLLESDRADDVSLYKKLDTVLIALEIILLLGLYVTVSPIYFSGSMAALFWIGVVAIGLLLPMVMSVYSMTKHSNLLIPICLMVIIGGLCLRYFIVYSGQLV